MEENLLEARRNRERVAEIIDRERRCSCRSRQEFTDGGIRDISVEEFPLVSVVSMVVHPSPLNPQLPGPKVEFLSYNHPRWTGKLTGLKVRNSADQWAIRCKICVRS